MNTTYMTVFIHTLKYNSRNTDREEKHNMSLPSFGQCYKEDEY